MTNQFATFNQTSPLASILHDPSIALASNCTRDFFGPTVQLVADALQARGGSSTFSQLMGTINRRLQNKARTEEQKEIIKESKLRPAKSSESPTLSSVRASLLVLIQHSIVLAKKSLDPKNRVVSSYQFYPDRARLLCRYPRFVEYTKKALDDTASALVEELLFQGRLRTVDAVVKTVEQLQLRQESNPSDKYTYRQAVLDSFRRLVGGGFICAVKKLTLDTTEENEFGQDAPEPPKKRRKAGLDGEDPAVLELLQSGQYKMLHTETMWQVNIGMFHDSLRALSLGRMVLERYGHRVQSAGSIVTGALKYLAYKKHAEKKSGAEFESDFTVDQICQFIPKVVLQNMERKPGGTVHNLFKALDELSKCTDPRVVREVAVGNSPTNTKFQISTHRLVEYAQDRIMHQVIFDSHGEIAARICSILKSSGHLESDIIAEHAMVPARDTREVLHRLYRENYLSLFNMNQGKQHNPASMFYLWSFSRRKGLDKVIDNVATALINMRLRRQHQVEVGRDWIERAKEAGGTDENENETDKLNYKNFCLGLERLDIAGLQLDETLMILKDFRLAN